MDAVKVAAIAEEAEEAEAEAEAGDDEDDQSKAGSRVQGMEACGRGDEFPRPVSAR